MRETYLECLLHLSSAKQTEIASLSRATAIALGRRNLGESAFHLRFRQSSQGRNVLLDNLSRLFDDRVMFSWLRWSVGARHVLGALGC